MFARNSIGVACTTRRYAFFVVLASLLAVQNAWAGNVTSTWTGNGATNRWGEAANWNPVGVPDNDGVDVYHVVIDGDAAQDVEIVLDVSPYTIQTLTIDAGDTLTLVPAATLNIAGGLVTVNGVIQINPLNATGLTRLTFPENTQIVGAGEVHMMGEPGRCLIQVGNDDTLTLGQAPAPPEGNPVIHGRGVISGNALVNNSTISADMTGETLVFYFFNQLANNGVIEGVAPTSARGGTGILSFDFTNMVKTTKGILRGDIGVNGSNIVGGIIADANLTFQPGSFTTPPSTIQDANISSSTIVVAPGFDPSFPNNPVLSSVTADQTDLYVGAIATPVIGDASFTNCSFVGDPASTTDEVTLSGTSMMLGNVNVDDLGMFINGLPVMSIDQAIFLRAVLLRISGQTTLVPTTPGMPATAHLENTSIVPATGPTDSLAADSNVLVTFSGTSSMSNMAATLEGNVEFFDDFNFQLMQTVMADAVTKPNSTLTADDWNATLLSLQSGGAAIVRRGGLSMESWQVTPTASVEVDPGAFRGPQPSSISVSVQAVIELTDEDNWSWGPGSILALTGGVGATTGDFTSWTRLEVGGTDLGTDPATHSGDPAGFANNFDLSVLRIDPGAHAYLEDLVDNGNRNGPGGVPEALYVDTLEFADAAGQLNLNGLHLYFQSLVGDAAQIVDVPVAPSCPADLGGDGQVSVTDLLDLLAAWGPNPGHPADINGDGSVDVLDLLELLAAWGPCP